jgi:hypothetical protein
VLIAINVSLLLLERVGTLTVMRPVGRVRIMVCIHRHRLRLVMAGSTRSFLTDVAFSEAACCSRNMTGVCFPLAASDEQQNEMLYGERFCSFELGK